MEIINSLYIHGHGLICNKQATIGGVGQKRIFIAFSYVKNPHISSNTNYFGMFLKIKN